MIRVFTGDSARCCGPCRLRSIQCCVTSSGGFATTIIPPDRRRGLPGPVHPQPSGRVPRGLARAETRRGCLAQRRRRLREERWHWWPRPKRDSRQYEKAHPAPQLQGAGLLGAERPRPHGHPLAGRICAARGRVDSSLTHHVDQTIANARKREEQARTRQKTSSCFRGRRSTFTTPRESGKTRAPTCATTGFSDPTRTRTAIPPPSPGSLPDAAFCWGRGTETPCLTRSAAAALLGS